MGENKSLWSKFKELIICHLCLAVTFITTGIVVDIIQASLYVTIRPFNPRLYRKINYYVTYTLNSQIVFLVEWWSGTKTILYSDRDDVKKYFGKEHAYILMNHCYEVDWMLGWVICDRVGVLGNAKVYVKKMLQYAPVLGWSWKFQEIVFLERNWEKDKRNLGHQLNRLVSYPNPIWLTLFPEGTRFTKEKHELSMEVARQKGLPELKHHLLPRTRGFVESIKYLREKVPAIYDVTIAFDPKKGNSPSVFNMLNGKNLEGYLHIERIPMEQVPENEEEAAKWLHKLYQKKDKLLDNFLKKGSFDPNGEFEELKNFEYFELPRRHYSLLNLCFWGAIIVFPLLYYIYLVLTSGSYFYITFAVIIILFSYIGLNKLINLTKISAGSDYGSNSVNGNVNGQTIPIKNIGFTTSNGIGIKNET